MSRATTVNVYEVRGQRAIYREEADTDILHRVGTTKESFLRYETLSIRDAEAFAT
jgi:hypothetical protein